MKRRLAVAVAAGMGALAGINRMLAGRASALTPPLGPDVGTFRWRGMDVAYSEGGDPEQPDVLLLHDIHSAGSSREFVRIFDELTDEYHVIAPDLPGFGRSNRPPIGYNADLFEAFVTDVVETITEEPAILASGLSAPYAIAAAEEVNVAKLLFICPRASATGKGRRYLGRLHRLPLIGTGLTNLRTARRTLRQTIGNYRLFDSRSLTDDDLTYFWESAHQPGARFAIGSIIAGDLDVRRKLGPRLAELPVPTTLLWGRGAHAPPVGKGRKLAEQADAKLVVIDRTRAWPHYEQPDPFSSLLVDELASIPNG